MLIIEREAILDVFSISEGVITFSVEVLLKVKNISGVDVVAFR